jgi:hypothetical protein
MRYVVTGACISRAKVTDYLRNLPPNFSRPMNRAWFTDAPSLRTRLHKMRWMIAWSTLCAIIAALFLTVFTLQGAPMDEWIVFVVLGAVPWLYKWIRDEL